MLQQETEHIKKVSKIGVMEKYMGRFEEGHGRNKEASF